MPSTRAIPTDTSVFDTLKERDVLVHHPYDSFTTTVERLIEEAAVDPDVLAIKQTLYRTSGEASFVARYSAFRRPNRANRSWRWCS